MHCVSCNSCGFENLEVAPRFCGNLWAFDVSYEIYKNNPLPLNTYPTAFPYGNGMVLHFYQQQESSMTKTVHKVINKGLKAYV